MFGSTHAFQWSLKQKAIDLTLSESFPDIPFFFRFWSNPGSAGFKLRGPNYLNDRMKISAGEPRFTLDWVYILKLDHPTKNVARFLPALRQNLFHGSNLEISF